MSKRKHKRKRRVHITPKGYVVLSVAALAVIFGIWLVIRICIVSFKDKIPKKAEDDSSAPSSGSVSASIENEPTPEGAVFTPEILPTITPSPTPALASTGARLPTAEEEEGAVEGIVRTSNCAMRKGPGKNYDIIHKYDVGEHVLVYGFENGYAFIKMLSDERIGFMSADFIKKFGLLPSEAASNTPVPTCAPGTVMGLVNVEELSFRSKPSKDNNTPIGVCDKETLLWVYFQVDDFYYVENTETGLKGYVFADYVMTAAPAPTGTPVPGA